MKLVLMADTHGRHRNIDIPDGDVLIHAGDFSAWFGALDELHEFNDFLGQLPHPYKIVIAGNHDFSFERENAESRAALTNAHYLQDDGIEIEGMTFYGSPWQPEFLNLAFNLPRGEPLRRKWRKIPPDTNVLITHGPPYGIGDKTFDGHHVGCEDLLVRVQTIKPRLHVFGHIHEGRGQTEIDDTTFVNAATDRDGWAPFVVELD
jgi:Icc-related predicted phosphoesterase